MKPIDIAGFRFGRLFVLSQQGKKREELAWLCQCECGNQIITGGYKLRSGQTQSCGCLHKEVISNIYSKLNKSHGMSSTPEYKSWTQMIDRCERTTHEAYHRYGGRGIKVCKAWRNSFEAFYADMGARPKGLTIDRIDNDGNYELSNCKWSTPKQQANNRVTTKKNPEVIYG